MYNRLTVLPLYPLLERALRSSSQPESHILSTHTSDKPKTLRRIWEEKANSMTKISCLVKQVHKVIKRRNHPTMQLFRSMRQQLQAQLLNKCLELSKAITWSWILIIQSQEHKETSLKICCHTRRCLSQIKMTAGSWKAQTNTNSSTTLINQVP